MLKPRGALRLVQELLEACLGTGRSAVRHFDGHFAFQIFVEAVVHPPEAAGTERAFDRIAADELLGGSAGVRMVDSPIVDRSLADRSPAVGLIGRGSNRLGISAAVRFDSRAR